MVVTVDGPAGAGKSSVSRELASRLGYAFLDTGALYRAVALAADRQGVDIADEAAVAAWLPGLDIASRPGDGKFQVLLDGGDVEPFIRNDRISQMASRLSAQGAVRAFLLELQRAAGRAGDLVAEGRDMGTVVFPDAEAKFFLTASEPERAHRRWLELRQAGQDVELEEVLEQLRRRDQRDAQREHSPLKPADDAQVVDTTPLSFEAVVELLFQRVKALPPGGRIG